MYRTCPDCGCSLDPGESCDCGGKPLVKDPERRESQIRLSTDGGILRAIIYERK